jgi:hypothetical protein
METNPLSETLCSLVFRILDDAQSPKIQYFFNYRPQKKAIKIFM